MVVQESEKNIRIRLGCALLEGELGLPEKAAGLVVFAHGSGSGRHSPRNQFVAAELREAGLGTLRVDLLTVDENKDEGTRFNVDLLTDRLEGITAWLKGEHPTRPLSIGYFGGSTGAAAALCAAARWGSEIKAVVSRGGRADLAEACLPSVVSPTLLIVGGYDDSVLELNRRAYERLSCEKEFFIIPEATPLFSEPGDLKELTRLSALWFRRHFPHRAL